MEEQLYDEKMRARLERAQKTLKKRKRCEELRASGPVPRESVSLRNKYINIARLPACYSRMLPARYGSSLAGDCTMRLDEFVLRYMYPHHLETPSGHRAEHHRVVHELLRIIADYPRELCQMFLERLPVDFDYDRHSVKMLRTYVFLTYGWTGPSRLPVSLMPLITKKMRIEGRFLSLAYAFLRQFDHDLRPTENAIRARAYGVSRMCAEDDFVGPCNLPPHYQRLDIPDTGTRRPVSELDVERAVRLHTGTIADRDFLSPKVLAHRLHPVPRPDAPPLALPVLARPPCTPGYYCRPQPPPQPHKRIKRDV